MPLTAVKIPKIGKEGFAPENVVPATPEKGALSPNKTPFLYRALQGKCGFFDSEHCFLGWALKTLASLNKEVRPFFLSDNSIWSSPSVSSLSDYSTWSY